MTFAENILVTTDFSRRAERAFEPARELARMAGGRVTLLHVHDLRVPHPAEREHRLASEAEADATLADRLASLAERAFGDLAPHTEVIDAQNVSKAICDYAEERGCDLIVIATEGVSGVKRWVLGSVAEPVVRQARCPVLTIPAPESS